MAVQPPVEYHLDQRDLITFVSAEWQTSAHEHGVPELTLEEVVGRSIWSFISCDSTRSLYRAAFNRVRTGQKRLVLPFRCDTAAARVWRRLVIDPGEEGALRLRSYEQAREPRSPVRLFERNAPRDHHLVRMCGWCQRVAAPDWVEVETAVQRLDLFNRPLMPELTHGICEECLQTLATRPDVPEKAKNALERAFSPTHLNSASLSKVAE